MGGHSTPQARPLGPEQSTDEGNEPCGLHVTRRRDLPALKALAWLSCGCSVAGHGDVQANVSNRLILRPTHLVAASHDLPPAMKAPVIEARQVRRVHKAAKQHVARIHGLGAGFHVLAAHIGPATVRSNQHVVFLPHSIDHERGAADVAVSQRTHFRPEANRAGGQTVVKVLRRG